MSKILTWQAELSNVITEPAELLKILNLDSALLPAAEQAARLFSLRVPRNFVARMKKGDIHDPLLRQVLPIQAELEEHAGYTQDPLQEKFSNPIPGLLHKYHGRVLLTIVGACGINCRYCFRRYFPYDENNPGQKGWEQALTYIANDPSITEVILSGGDPLVASDEHLAKLSQKIAAISHIKTLRIHTRLPIVVPQRITAEFIDWFTHSRLQPVLVVHCNHPQEINTELKQALLNLKKTNITLLNQAVLLQGVNDKAETLIKLSKALFDAGVLPYYLHLLDKVQSAAHFDVDETNAKILMHTITQKLPGYLVPKLVREVPSAASKCLVV